MINNSMTLCFIFPLVSASLENSYKLKLHVPSLIAKTEVLMRGEAKVKLPGYLTAPVTP